MVVAAPRLADGDLAARRPRVLVVDDDPAVGRLVGRVAHREGFDTATVHDGSAALAEVRRRPVDFVLVDLRMPGVDGLDLLRALRVVDPGCRAVLMTGHASIDTAVEAVRLGALDYLTKPFDFVRLRAVLSTVREEIERRRSLLQLEGDVAERLGCCELIGRGPAMQELFGLLRRLAPHVRVALITGESGTGKELVARALHRLGPRSDRRFVTIDCSTVVETLVESELFGHVRGAFTGATADKPGLFELADGATVFLDEVGELPASVQAKLLRVLESGDVQRVGAIEGRRVDVRVIAATNRELEAEVRARRFRGDLYYRLNVVPIALPPLRDRTEDIPYLTAAFLRRFAAELGTSVTGVTPGAERLLASAAWGGNVRELRNTLERACLLATGPLITERELAGGVAPAAAAPPGIQGGATAASAAAGGSGVVPLPLAVMEREQIRRALEACGGNKTAAARRLGLSRRALYRRLERHGIRWPPTATDANR